MSAYNGSGTFVVSGVGLPYVTATTISSTVANQLNTDLATGLSTAICKDGQTTTTARIPFAVGASFADSIIYGGVTLANSVTGTGSMVLGTAPTISAPVISGHPTIEGVTSTGATGTGRIVYSAGPTFTSTIAAAAMTTTGDITGAGYHLVTDGGSGGNCTITGFGHACVYSWNGLTADANWQVVCGGSGGVILNNGTTAWAAISDYRRKDVFGPFDTSGEIIDAVPVHLAAMKDKPDVRKAMFLAHELQTKVPHAVHGEKDGEKMQVVESTDPLVPILWAELKSLRARVAALET